MKLYKTERSIRPMEKMLEKLKGGLIVSCYAGPDFNAEMGVPQTMVCVAKSCMP